MDPSITQPRKDRARAALSARGNATKTRFAGFGTKQCGLQTLSWFACCAAEFQGRIETLGKVGRPRKSAEFREMNNRFSLNLGFDFFCNTERNERVCTPHKQLG